MALDDRDAKFEKVLARHLHGAERRVSCPDAEILAAYHERTLSPAELNTWKLHIAACARCQEVLAQLEITEEIPLDLNRRQSVASLAASAQPSSSGERGSARQPSAVQAINAKKDAGGARSRISLRWVLPAGAIAAGLLLWVTVHDKKIQDHGATPPVQIAQNRPEPPIVANGGTTPQSLNEDRRDQPASKLAAPAADAKPSDSMKSQRTAAASPTTPTPLVGGARVPSDALDQFQTQAKRSADTDGKRDKAQVTYDYRIQAKERSTAQPEALHKNVEEADRQQLAQDAVQEQKKLEIAAAVVAAPAPPRPAAAGITAADAGTPEAAAKQKAAGASPAASQSLEVMSSYNSKSALPREAAKDAKLLLAKDGKSAWRLGSAGAIEYSSNGGKNWVTQSSGVNTNLVAGSAPSKKICWIVGRAGTILLTTNAGADWKQLASPLADDLGGVQATDALHATIWDAANTRRYETSDAGVTWRNVPGE